MDKFLTVVVTLLVVVGALFWASSADLIQLGPVESAGVASAPPVQEPDAPDAAADAHDDDDDVDGEGPQAAPPPSEDRMFTVAREVPDCAGVVFRRADEAQFDETELTAIRTALLIQQCRDGNIQQSEGTEVRVPPPLNRTITIRWRLVPNPHREQR